MASRQKRRASSGNRVGMAVIATIVCILIGALLVQSFRLKKRISSFQAATVELQDQIQEEKDRAEDLEDLPDYVKSEEYIETAAREKFGLVYEDEIIFKPEE